MFEVCPHCQLIDEEAEFTGLDVIAPSAYPLAAKFADFNARYFNGRLPAVKLRFGVMKGLAGRFTYTVFHPRGVKPSRVWLHPDTRLDTESLTLTLSKEYKRSEKAFDAILLHEMIHVLMAFEGRYAESHGPLFAAEAQRVSQKSGITVPGRNCPRDEFAVPVGARDAALGVVLLHKANGAFSFALLNEKAALSAGEALRGMFEYAISRNVYTRVTVWTIKSPGWTEVSRGKLTVGRAVSRTTKFWVLKDKELLDDLMNNGTKVADINADSK